jgi:CRP-like cAMP-binding protein
MFGIWISRRLAPARDSRKKTANPHPPPARRPGGPIAQHLVSTHCRPVLCQLLKVHSHGYCSSLDCVGVAGSFTEGLDGAELRAVLAAATPRRLPARSAIYEQGQPAREFLQLSSGRARYFCITPDGRKMLMHWLVPGDVLGVSALLSPTSFYRLSAETVRASSFLVWDAATMRALIARSHQLSQNALAVAAAYLDLYIAAHGALASETARQRLAHVVSTLARTIGSDVAGGVELQVTNEELASAANITPFTASRLLNEWQASRAITKHRGNIVVHSPEGLFSHSGVAPEQRRA